MLKGLVKTHPIQFSHHGNTGKTTLRYLIPARNQLETMLRREGRWELAQRCFGCIPVMAELDRMRFNQTFEH